MYRLHGMAKKATAAAISVTSAARPNGVLFSAFLNEFAFAFNAFANISVLMTEGFFEDLYNLSAEATHMKYGAAKFTSMICWKSSAVCAVIACRLFQPALFTRTSNEFAPKNSSHMSKTFERPSFVVMSASMPDTLFAPNFFLISETATFTLFC